MLVTNVRQQRAIGRAATAAGGYFQLARRLSQAQADRTPRESRTAEGNQTASDGDRAQR